jgi:hypothetical protein
MRAHSQVRLRHPRIAPAYEAPGLAGNDRFIQAFEITPVAAAMAMDEYDGDRGWIRWHGIDLGHGALGSDVMNTPEFCAMPSRSPEFL